MRKKRLRQGFLLFSTLLVIYAAFRFTGCDFRFFWARRAHLGDLVTRLFPPDWGYASAILSPLLTTVRMSVTGTALGTLLALLAAPFCAATLGFSPVLRAVLRPIVQVLRSFPALILALAATFLFGLGAFSGTVALTIFTFAVLTRLTYEDIEAAPTGAYRALTAIGSGKLCSFVRAVLPEILPSYLTNALYLLETNVRHSAILGYVGAGGIGLLLNEKISWREYEKVGTILILLFIAVCSIEWLSTFLVSVVRGRRALSPLALRLLLSALALLILWCTLTLDGPDFSHTAPRIVRNILHGITHPDLGFFFSTGETGLPRLLFETVCISFLGTLLGVLPALLLAILNCRRFLPRLPALFFRLVLMAIRSVPFIIYGLIFIRVTGAGAFAGVLTLGVCSIGLLAKRFTLAIEALDFRPYTALRAIGVRFLPALVRTIWPQLWPVIASTVLYRFDVNLREASILGLVGAGGIGATLILSMNKYAWSTTGAIFFGTVLLVWVVDLVSGRLRKRLS